MLARFYFPCLNGFQLYLSTDQSRKRSFNRLVQKEGFNMLPLTEEEGSTIAWTCQLTDNYANMFVWCSPKLGKTGDPGVWGYQASIAHEAFHLALRASEYIHSHSPQAAEEPLAYLVSVVTECGCAMLDESLTLKQKRKILQNYNAVIL